MNLCGITEAMMRDARDDATVILLLYRTLYRGCQGVIILDDPDKRCVGLDIHHDTRGCQSQIHRSENKRVAWRRWISDQGPLSYRDEGLSFFQAADEMWTLDRENVKRWRPSIKGNISHARR
jgi:hypothetical protein